MSTGRVRKGIWVSLPVIMLAIVAVSILVPERSEAASVECFIQFPGVVGDVVDPAYRGWIFVPTWGFGVSGTPATLAPTGARSNLMQDFRFTSRMGSHSPRLFLDSLKGIPYPGPVLFACRKPGQTSFEFLRISLDGVMVKAYQSETPTTVGAPPMPMADTFPIDQASLVFERIRFSYRQPLPDGKPGPAAGAGWDVRKNMEFR
jgi:type VI protein secretion system component Hcp